MVIPAGEPGLQFHSPVQVEVAGLSHPGKVRSTNEDHYYIVRFGRFIETLHTNLPAEKQVNRSEEASYAILVADGVGGGAAGDVASREAIHLLLGLVLQAPEWILRTDDDAAAHKVLQRAATRVAQINKTLEQQARMDSGLQGFATTLTAVWNLGRQAFVSHVGDSRAYLFRGQVLEQLTRDHRFAQDLADRGVIGSEEVSQHRMRKVLTRALGDTDVEGAAELRHLDLEDGDSLLLCTDGLTDMVPDERIAATLAGARTCELACQRLLEQALEAGGKDNITVAVARYRVEA
jgi:protein phosphatase